MIAFDFMMGVLTGVAVGICGFFLYAVLCLEKIQKKLKGAEKNEK